MKKIGYEKESTVKNRSQRAIEAEKIARILWEERFGAGERTPFWVVESPVRLRKSHQRGL